MHGYPAVGVCLSERTRVQLSGRNLDDWDLRRVAVSDRPVVLRVLRELQSVVPQIREVGCLRVRITSAVARGVGLGSSAALCAAMAGAALAATGGRGIETSEVWALAHRLERNFHGTPSGVDTGLALYPGAAVFTRESPDGLREGVAPSASRGLPRHRALHPTRVALVLAAVPRSGDCAALIARVGERMRSGDLQASSALEALGAIASEACELLGGAPRIAPRLGALADRAMDQLRMLGLSDPSQDRMLEAGSRAGALGGKLSGAGAGGAFFLVFPDAARARRALHALRETAAQRGIRLVAPLRVMIL